jgi:hypothetical protein
MVRGFACLLLSSVLAACTAQAPPAPAPRTQPEARLPASEARPPASDDWSGVARAVAEDLAKAAAGEEAKPTAVPSVQGAVPDYFRDLLIADLVELGVPVTEAKDAPARVACRVTSVGGPPPRPSLSGAPSPGPRGTSPAAPARPGEALVLCFLMRDGAYVAGSRRSLATAGTPVLRQ